MDLIIIQTFFYEYDIMKTGIIHGPEAEGGLIWQSCGKPSVCIMKHWDSVKKAGKPTITAIARNVTSIIPGRKNITLTERRKKSRKSVRRKSHDG
jgi:hypothetical protein